MTRGIKKILSLKKEEEMGHGLRTEEYRVLKEHSEMGIQ